MLNKEKKEQARQLLKDPNITITEVATKVGINWLTAKRIAERVRVGQDYKVRRREITKPTVEVEVCTSTASTATNSPPVVALTNFVQSPKDELTGGRCAQIGCAFPAFQTGLCRQHYMDQAASYSFSASTMTSAYFLPERHYTRRLLG